MKILFICRGNVGRSQMAEAFYNKFTGTFDASSAGILDYTPTKYGTPTQDIITFMLEEHIDISKHKVKTVTKEMIEKSDKVYVLCRKDECPEYICNSPKVEFWNIPDPYKIPEDEARKIRDLIKKKIQQLINQ